MPVQNSRQETVDDQGQGTWSLNVIKRGIVYRQYLRAAGDGAAGPDDRWAVGQPHHAGRYTEAQAAGRGSSPAITGATCGDEHQTASTGETPICAYPRFWKAAPLIPVLLSLAHPPSARYICGTAFQRAILWG